MNKYFPFSEPAQVDILNEREIILYLRALLDLHDLLLNGLEAEMDNFRRKLLSVGWGSQRITELVYLASLKNRYENLISHPVFGEKFRY